MTDRPQASGPAIERPSRGEIWGVNLDPVRGHEQGGERPGLVVSADPFNHGASGLVVLLPLTTRGSGVPLHLPVMPPEGGLRRPSWVLCDQVRTVAQERLIRRWGRAAAPTMAAVEERLRRLLQP